MPSHEEDIRLIPIIQQFIQTQINTYPNHIYILCGDFNRDIALIGRQNRNNNTPPQAEDTQWRVFIDNLNLEYIPTNTTYSRQGGHNYMETSLIDGFFISSQNNIQFTSTTITNLDLNSDHFPITLHIPPNTLLARPPPPPNKPKS